MVICRTDNTITGYTTAHLFFVLSNEKHSMSPRGSKSVIAKYKMHFSRKFHLLDIIKKTMDLLSLGISSLKVTKNAYPNS